jgi:hypothetical protein
LRRGLIARTVVLEDENLQAFASLLSCFERKLDPQNEDGRALVKNMAVGYWRLRRLWAIERSSLTAEMDRYDPAHTDSEGRAALAFRAWCDESHTLALLNRYDARFDRQFTRSLTLLLKVRQASRPAASEETCVLPCEPSPKIGHLKEDVR